MKTLKVKVSKSLHLTIIWLFFTLLTVSITTAQSADAQKANVVSDVHPDFVTDVTTGGTDPIHITDLVNDKKKDKIKDHIKDEVHPVDPVPVTDHVKDKPSKQITDKKTDKITDRKVNDHKPHRRIVKHRLKNQKDKVRDRRITDRKPHRRDIKHRINDRRDQVRDRVIDRHRDKVRDRISDRRGFIKN